METDGDHAARPLYNALGARRFNFFLQYRGVILYKYPSFQLLLYASLFIGIYVRISIVRQGG